MEGGPSSESMMRQAQQVWAMLDDMAENNPAAYRAFMDKQKKERDNYMAPPEPHMCVKTQMSKPKNSIFYINFCTWKKIPPPADPSEAVKVAGSAIGQINDDKDKAAVTAVAFSEKILEEYGKNAVNKSDQDTLIQIAMDFIEKQHSNVKINRRYTILDVAYKGSVKMVQDSLMQAFGLKDKKTDEELVNVMKNFAPVSMESPESLINQLNGRDSDTDTSVKTSSLSDGLSGISLSTQPVRKGLIEEVSSSSRSLPEPSHDLVTQGADSSITKTYVLKIKLPGVRSVAECQLDISRDDVYLFVDNMYELKLNLPSAIMDEEASAKFSKKSSVLTLTMPVARN